MGKRVEYLGTRQVQVDRLFGSDAVFDGNGDIQVVEDDKIAEAMAAGAPLSYRIVGDYDTYGNLQQVVVDLDLDSTRRGATDTDSLMLLPKGATILSVRMVVVDGAAGSDTIDLGTVQDGDGGWTDDVDYFFDGQAINTEGTFDSLPTSRHAPLVIDEDNVYLTVTYNDTVNAANNLHIRYYVNYQVEGNT